MGADKKFIHFDFGPHTLGIKGSGGSLTLDNTVFTNLNDGVNGGGWNNNTVPALTLLNMPAENNSRPNIDWPWEPYDWPNRASTSAP